MKRYIIIIAILLIGNSIRTKAQSPDQYPEIGKPMPEFKLKEVQYYSKSKLSLADFKGKWLILDFWSAHCSTCIEKMPKMSAMQEKFRDKVQFIMVGYSGSQYLKRSDKQLIKMRFENTRKEYNLNLAIAYDSLLFHRFDIWTAPYIVVIDPKGIVKAITYKLEEENLNDLILNKSVVLPYAMRRAERKAQKMKMKEDKSIIQN